MTVSANKGMPLTMPEVNAEPEINVVTYDEQQPVEAIPVEAVPVDHMPLTTPSAPTVGGLHPTTSTNNNNVTTSLLQPQQQQNHHHGEYYDDEHNADNHHHHPHHHTNNNNQYHHDSSAMTDGGCECSLCGDTTLRRIHPGFNFSIALCGDTYIDIRDSKFAPNAKLTLMLVRLCGNTVLLVPPGTNVIVRRLLLCGNRDIHVADDHDHDDIEQQQQGRRPPARLTLTILSLCGDIRVRSDPNEELPEKKFQFPR